MKNAVILVHPAHKSFTRAMADTYIATVKPSAGEVVVRDLYREGFDPRLQASEIPGSPGFQPAADVVAERALIADADVFAFFYPLWFNAPPAMMKGYVDRVFGLGFGYGPGPGGQAPLLENRKLISFTSSGAPESWVHDTGAFHALYTLFDRHIGAMCGLQVLEHVHNGGVVSGFPEMAMDEARRRVRKAVRRHGLG